MPKGEVVKVRLSSTGRIEYFLTGTEPAHSCGPVDTPAPIPSVKAVQTTDPDAPPTAVVIPPGQAGDGETFMKLDSRGDNAASAAPARTP
jgi:hypothetical protein